MYYNRLFSEFLHHPMIAMEGQRFNAAFALVMQNLREGIEIDYGKKTLGSLVSGGKQIDFESSDEFCEAIDTNSYRVQAGNDGGSPSGEEEPQTFVSVMRIEGTMTRNGDDCTYGSKDHAYMMRRAANDANCRGHVLLINSGGGASSTLLDYREAINYCLSKGQNVVAVVDECAASAACFTANMTNRIFAKRESDEVGSLGMFATFTTIADGTKLPMTNEIVHIRYAEQSKDKNYEWREAAKGNLKPIDQMLKDELAQVLANTQKDRPSLKDNQLTGKMYPASEVMGSMVDEIGGLDEAINWLVADYDARQGAPLATKDVAPKQKTSNAKAAASASATAQNPDNKMYEQIAAALNLESIEHTQDGVMLNTPLADQLEAHLQGHADALSAKDKALADALAQKDQEIADLKAAQEKALTDLTEAKDKEIADLNAAHQQAMTEAETKHGEAVAQLNQTISEKETALTEANTNLTKANEELATANAQITDLTAKVEELNQQAPAVQAGAQPADNGQQGPQTAQIVTNVYQWDNNLSVEENMKRKAEFEKR